MGVKIKPLHDRVLIKPHESKETVSGGIIIPDTAKEKPQEGVIVAIGGGKTLENGQKKEFVVKVGDNVIYSKYAGTEIKLDGNEHLLMKEDDILGIIN